MDKCFPLIFILLVKSMRQKKFQKFVFQKNVCWKFQFVQDLVCRLRIGQSLDPSWGQFKKKIPKIFSTQFFLVPKFLFDLKEIFYKIFCAKLCLDQNIFLTNNFVKGKNFVDPKFFGPKKFWNEKFLEPKIIVDPKIFGPKSFKPKIFVDSKSFWTRDFFGPKMFSRPKIFSDQQIFGLRIFPQIFLDQTFCVYSIFFIQP